MMNKYLKYFFAAVILMGATLVSCDKNNNNNDDDNNTNNPTDTTTLTTVESPYLICAGRNPGGVGFDFEYHGNKGGANNMDAPSANDFEEDLVIKTIKGEKPDGSLGGAPFVKLYSTVDAVNYSEIDPSCKGITAFQNLNSTNIQSYTLGSDDCSFDPASLSTGSTNQPLMNELITEFQKLIIGQTWKAALTNSTPDDEPIYIVKTREGTLVKFIVTQFPADPAPTATGYVAIEWDFLN